MWSPEHRLYPYQERATDLMSISNTLLAYEMGTGKTPTTLFALEDLRANDALDTAWVVVPASLKYQWAAEIGKFTDQSAIVIDGPPKKRQDQYARVAAEEPGYIVLSYDSVVRDWEWIRAVLKPGLRAMVLDEATAIKSFTSKRSKHLKKTARHFQVRFALTGTPIENGKLEELFSIMQWVDDEVLGSWPRFEERHIRRNQLGWIEGYRNFGALHRRLESSGSFARATHKEPEVAKYLPKVVERPTLRVPLSKRAARVNDWIGSSVLSDLDEFSSRVSSLYMDLDSVRTEDWNHPDGRMMAKITVLRQFLSNPESIFTSSSPFVDELIEREMLTPTPAADKLRALYGYLDDFLDSNEGKAVVFSSFLNSADTIHRRYPNSVLLNGGMTAKERQRSISGFRNDPDIRVFVSTDAGGYGLDLPEANMLINYDLPWKPGMLAQRNARIKRASSAWDYVVIQNIVCEGTIEERMLEMLRHKMAVAEAAVDGEGIDALGQLLSDLDSLRSFLNGTVAKELKHAS